MAEPRAGDPAGGVLALREQRRLPVRGDLRQGVDGGAAGAVVERRAVGVDRDEQVGVEPAGDLVALVEAAIAVVVAGHGDADPAGRGERVADGEGEREGDVLFRLSREFRGRARVAAAMAGIDHHQRRIVAARRGHPGQRPELVRAQRIERNGHGVAGPDVP